MEKRYHSYAGYFREKYGERLQKLVIDAGFTCPNRDGTVGTGGCSYCDNAAFHPGYSTPGKSIAQQLDEGISFHQVRYRGASHYLAYFQSYSNTYGPVERLRQVYSEALDHPKVVGLVIGTRPDCIDDARLDLLEELRDTPMAGISPLALSSGTLREVSKLSFHSSPHRLRKARMKSGRSSGSPPPKVTPPPVARKYSSSFLVSSYNSSGVRVLCGKPASSVCGFRQYLHRSGQVMKTTRVFTPSPSMAILCLATAAISACVFIFPVKKRRWYEITACR